nr:MAG TPA: hypothetical protein [Caudoviricetes sp.]
MRLWYFAIDSPRNAADRPRRYSSLSFMAPPF